MQITDLKFDVSPPLNVSVALILINTERDEVINRSRLSNGGLAAIERDDWPGPPEPAAAYPELCESVSLFDF